MLIGGYLQPLHLRILLQNRDCTEITVRPAPKNALIHPRECLIIAQEAHQAHGLVKVAGLVKEIIV